MERCTASPVDPSSSCGSMWSCSSDVEEGFLQEEEEVTSSSSLYHMSDLMAVLPIKKGLSKHYEGKSQSFTSLACARCLEDLPKRDRRIGNKVKKEAVGGEKRRNSSLSCCSKIMKKKGFKCSSPLPGRRLQEFN